MDSEITKANLRFTRSKLLHRSSHFWGLFGGRPGKHQSFSSSSLFLDVVICLSSGKRWFTPQFTDGRNTAPPLTAGGLQDARRGTLTLRDHGLRAPDRWAPVVHGEEKGDEQEANGRQWRPKERGGGGSWWGAGVFLVDRRALVAASDPSSHLSLLPNKFAVASKCNL